MTPAEYEILRILSTGELGYSEIVRQSMNPLTRKEYSDKSVWQALKQLDKKGYVTSRDGAYRATQTGLDAYKFADLFQSLRVAAAFFGAHVDELPSFLREKKRSKSSVIGYLSLKTIADSLESYILQVAESLELDVVSTEILIRWKKLKTLNECLESISKVLDGMAETAGEFAASYPGLSIITTVVQERIEEAKRAAKLVTESELKSE